MRRKLVFGRMVTGIFLGMMVWGVSFMALTWSADPVQAAPPRTAAGPSESSLRAAAVITATKASATGPEVKPGQTITYTISIAADQPAVGMVITDPVPAGTALIGTITGTPANSVTGVSTVGGTLVWSLTQVAAGSRLTLTAAVQVNAGVTNGLIISNRAWLKTADGITPTNAVTHVVSSTSRVYLPLIIKSTTALTVESVNTGNFTFEVRQIGDNALVASCFVANNSLTFCARFPAGAYRIIALNTQCGTGDTIKTYDPGPQIQRVSCP